MSDYEAPSVSLTRNGSVGIVTFSRPPHNYFDLRLIDELVDVLQAVDADDALRAVVLQSEGKSFCAGAHFSGREGSGGEQAEGSLADPSDLYRSAVRLFRTRKPIVAAIQGAAIGGGLGLAMIADFRIAAPEARFAGNFVKIGIHPGFGLTHILPRLIGPQRAATLLLTGRRIGGEEAVALGLADHLSPIGELGEAAFRLASEIAENAPLAVESLRATLRSGLADAVAAQNEHECREQIALFASEDFKEGVAAVAERRVANFARC